MIDEEAELTALSREGGAIQLHGANARLHGLSIHNDTAATQGDGHVVEVGLACVLGIPQIRPVNGDEHVSAGVPQVGCDREGGIVAYALHRDGVVVGQLGGGFEGVIGIAAEVYGVVEIQLGVAPVVILGGGVDGAGVEEGLPNGGGLYHVEGHRPPQPSRHGAAEDVPAKGGGGFAGIEGGVIEEEGARRGGQNILLRLDHGGVNVDHQLVVRGLYGRILIQRNLVGQEHIFPSVDPFAVEVGVENGIHALQPQDGHFVDGYGGLVKGSLVDEVPILQGAELCDIRTEVGILQKPRPHHVQLEIAGDNGGDGHAKVGGQMANAVRGDSPIASAEILMRNNGQRPVFQLGSHGGVLSIYKDGRNVCYRYYTTKQGGWQVGCTKKTKIYSTFLCKTA